MNNERILEDKTFYWLGREWNKGKDGDWYDIHKEWTLSTGSSTWLGVRSVFVSVDYCDGIELHITISSPTLSECIDSIEKEWYSFYEKMYP